MCFQYSIYQQIISTFDLSAKKKQRLSDLSAKKVEKPRLFDLSATKKANYLIYQSKKFKLFDLSSGT